MLSGYDAGSSILDGLKVSETTRLESTKEMITRACIRNCVVSRFTNFLAHFMLNM